MIGHKQKCLIVLDEVFNTVKKVNTNFDIVSINANDSKIFWFLLLNDNVARHCGHSDQNSWWKTFLLSDGDKFPWTLIKDPGFTNLKIETEDWKLSVLEWRSAKTDINAVAIKKKKRRIE